MQDLKNVLSHIMTIGGQTIYGQYVTVIRPPEGFSTAKTIISVRPLSEEEIDQAVKEMATANAQRLLLRH